MGTVKINVTEKTIELTGETTLVELFNILDRFRVDVSDYKIVGYSDITPYINYNPFYIDSTTLKIT